MFAVSIGVGGALCWRLAAFAAVFYQEDRVEGRVMKPNDEALDEALSVTQIPEESMREYMRRVLTAAFAAQFPPSEDYRILVNSLRDSETRYIAGVPAADALEALLAERAAWKGRQEATAAILKRVETERDALLARLAPVDDYNLEIMAAKEFIEATTDMPPRTTYTISKRSLSGARAAIAAIRPHIEAAERERCAKIADSSMLPCDISGDLILDRYTADTIAAAIRRGK